MSACLSYRMDIILRLCAQTACTPNCYVMHQRAYPIFSLCIFVFVYFCICVYLYLCCSLHHIIPHGTRAHKRMWGALPWQTISYQSCLVFFCIINIFNIIFNISLPLQNISYHGCCVFFIINIFNILIYISIFPCNGISYQFCLVNIYFVLSIFVIYIYNTRIYMQYV